MYLSSSHKCCILHICVTQWGIPMYKTAASVWWFSEVAVCCGCHCSRGHQLKSVSGWNALDCRRLIHAQIKIYLHCFHMLYTEHLLNMGWKLHFVQSNNGQSFEWHCLLQECTSSVSSNASFCPAYLKGHALKEGVVRKLLLPHTSWILKHWVKTFPNPSNSLKLLIYILRFLTGYSSATLIWFLYSVL